MHLCFMVNLEDLLTSKAYLATGVMGLMKGSVMIVGRGTKSKDHSSMV